MSIRRIHRVARAIHATEEFRPGQYMPDDGDFFEPETEPVDYDEYLSNRYMEDYGEPTEEIRPETGYLLRNGMSVPMGGWGTRAEDHRGAIPSSEAMLRWGWDHSFVKEMDEGGRGDSLVEFIRRSGAIRVHASSDAFFHGEGSPTMAQRRAIIDWVATTKPSSVNLDFPSLRGMRQQQGVDLDHPESWEIEDVLSRI